MLDVVATESRCLCLCFCFCFCRSLCLGSLCLAQLLAGLEHEPEPWSQLHAVRLSVPKPRTITSDVLHQGLLLLSGLGRPGESFTVDLHEYLQESLERVEVSDVRVLVLLARDVSGQILPNLDFVLEELLQCSGADVDLLDRAGLGRRFRGFFKQV